jgi:hypothetical protein
MQHKKGMLFDINKNLGSEIINASTKAAPSQGKGIEKKEIDDNEFNNKPIESTR